MNAVIGRPRERILLLDTDLETRNHYIILAIRDALARQPEVEIVVLANLLEAVERFRAEACDSFIAVGSAAAQAPILSRLCALARHSVLWTTEDPYELAPNVAQSQWFDHVFTNDLGCVEAYGGRATHLPLAASTLFQDLSVLKTDADYRYDLLFIGTAWPNRVAAIDTILSSFPRRLRVKIGLSTNPHLPPVRLSQPGLWTGWRTSNAQFARLANVSRITLGLERRFSSAGAASAKGSTPPPRLFEVALAGGYQVFLADGDEAARYFEPDREFALCRSLGEVIEQIRWALDHPELRIERARAARERALREHLYDHRARDLVAGLRATPGRSTRRLSPAAEPEGNRRILVVTHNVLGRKPGGGVEIYQELLKRIGARFSTYFMYPEHSGGHSNIVVRHPGGELDRYQLPHALHDHLLHDAAVENLFQRVLFEFRIDLVHYQHLLHHPLSLPIISRACGVPSVFTLHDYHLICSRLNLLDYRGTYCDPAELAPTTCDICLSATANLPAGSQARRRNFLRQVLGSVDLLLTNTPWSLEYMGRIYPELAGTRAAVLEMCLASVPPRRLPTRTPAAVLRVAIPGNFTDVKGGHQLVRLFNLMRGDRVHFTIMGTLTAPFPDIFSALQFPNVSVHGGYRTDQVHDLLAQQDMSLHLSIWPETYVISLSEAWASLLVPIVARLGALGERVTDGVDGFTVDPYDLGRTAALLRRFAEDRGELEPIVAAIAQKKLMTPVQHLARLRDIYEGLIEERPVSHRPNDARPFPGFNLATAALGIRTNSARWDSDDNIWDEPLAAPAATLAADEAVGFENEIPAEYGHLPVEQVRISDVAHFGLDVFSVDKLVGAEAVAVASVGGSHRLRLSGWTYRRSYGPPIKRFVRLRGPSFSRVYLATGQPRPDIGALFQDAAANDAGFSIEIPLETLPRGNFWVDLAALHDGHIVDYRQVARLDMVPPRRLAFRDGRSGLDGQIVDALPGDYGGLPVVIIGNLRARGVWFTLDDLLGDGGLDASGRPRLLAEGTQSLSLVGWAFHPDGGMPVDVFCRVRGPHGETLFALGARRRPDVVADTGNEMACEGGFAGTLEGAAFAPGAHRIDLLQVYERQIVEFREIGHFTVLAGAALRTPDHIEAGA